jgi:hypothetical protein
MFVAKNYGKRAKLLAKDPIPTITWPYKRKGWNRMIIGF